MQNANEIYNVKENCKAEVKNKPIPIVMIWLGIAIPDCFSGPGISGLKNANPGIESLILN